MGRREGRPWVGIDLVDGILRGIVRGIERVLGGFGMVFLVPVVAVVVVIIPIVMVRC